MPGTEQHDLMDCMLEKSEGTSPKNVPHVSKLPHKQASI